MARYLLMQSRDPYETREVTRDYELAAGLADAGNDVTLMLVQNGVLPARAGAAPHGLDGVLAAGATVVADAFALRQRGIPTDALATGVSPAPLELAVDRMAAGDKLLWL